MVAAPRHMRAGSRYKEIEAAEGKMVKVKKVNRGEQNQPAG